MYVPVSLESVSDNNYHRIPHRQSVTLYIDKSSDGRLLLIKLFSVLKRTTIQSIIIKQRRRCQGIEEGRKWHRKGLEGLEEHNLLTPKNTILADEN